jgi:hypothetical protein
LRSFEQHNSDSIVQDRLSEDDGVEFRLYLVRIEDGKNCDRISSRQRSADRHGFDEVDLEAIEGYPSPQEQDEAKHEGGYECSGKSEGKNSADVFEEVPLSRVSRGDNCSCCALT